MPALRSPQEPARRRLILGLGNPGKRYRDTRHNLGFRVVEELARRLDGELSRLECNALTLTREDVMLAAPQTYMNRSGYAVRCLAERHELEPEQILVVFDDVALPLGKLRLRTRGGPGGHRGMESVIRNLRSEEVPRLRLGVAGEGVPAPGEDLVDYVLEPFGADEKEVVDEMLSRAAAACESWLREGPQATMDRFNG